MKARVIPNVTKYAKVTRNDRTLDDQSNPIKTMQSSIPQVQVVLQERRLIRGEGRGHVVPEAVLRRKVPVPDPR